MTGYTSTSPGIRDEKSRTSRSGTLESDGSYRGQFEYSGSQADLSLNIKMPFPSPNPNDKMGFVDERSVRSDDVLSCDTDNSNISLGERRRRHTETKLIRSRRSSDKPGDPTSVQYHGVNMSQAASQGNLPLCVLLWGVATAKRVNLLDPDLNGNTPFHFAALADVPEVRHLLSK